MRKAMLLPLIGAALGTCALAADKRIPGTSVSYKVQSAGGKNTSMVFVDELSDPTGKTYLAVKCEGEGTFQLSLYSRDSLGKSEGATNVIVGKGDALHRGLGTVRVDRQTGKIAVWDAKGATNDGLLKTMADTRGLLTMTVQRRDLKPVSYSFNSVGIWAGLEAVRHCF